MRKKLVVAGVLTGGIALTGLAGSAYAEGGTPAAKPAVPAGKGRVAITCLPKGKPVKGRPSKDAVLTKKLLVAGKPMIVKSGKTLPAPPPVTKDTAKLIAKKKAYGTIKIWTANKGIHCSTVKPGIR
jgi:hypothetical protein